jgi:hypothetical protein
MRIAFTGSRHWKNEFQIATRLLELRQEFGDDLTICHGDAKNGVDAMIKKIAKQYGIAQVPFPVDRILDGNHRGAPLNRNRRMLEVFEPDLLVAFRSTGKSNGTDNTKKLSIPVETISEDETNVIP